MRLCYVVLVAVGALLASVNALPGTTDQTASKVATPLNVLDGEQNNVRGRRFLRIKEAASEQIPNAEGRRLVNIDLILKDAAISVKKAVKWKAQFKWWKLMNKKPFKLSQELGISHLGTAMTSHRKWKKLVAYTNYYGKGPLRYDS